jgi:hypothetical protein
MGGGFSPPLYQGLARLVLGRSELLAMVSPLLPPVSGVHASEWSPLKVNVGWDDLKAVL